MEQNVHLSNETKETKSPLSSKMPQRTLMMIGIGILLVCAILWFLPMAKVKTEAGALGGSVTSTDAMEISQFAASGARINLFLTIVFFIFWILSVLSLLLPILHKTTEKKRPFTIQKITTLIYPVFAVFFITSMSGILKRFIYIVYDGIYKVGNAANKVLGNLFDSPIEVPSFREFLSEVGVFKIQLTLWGWLGILLSLGAFAFMVHMARSSKQ
ncbi:MAG: hypothetical protein Q4Q17_05340 [Tissierellia bacterium]|nr:hypothetical protein [Tissierellia bacterium]